MRRSHVEIERRWIAILAHKQNRLIVEIEQILATDPDSLMIEIAAARLELAQDKARELIRTEPKNMGALKKLRTSDDEDDRLAVALYEREKKRKKMDGDE